MMAIASRRLHGKGHVVNDVAVAVGDIQFVTSNMDDLSAPDRLQ
jgi:hypothetical protein